MQSLISQISNIFATQSLNSIENSGLEGIMPISSEFGGVLESLTEGNPAANFAALNGNQLQTSYTPISFQITQFSLASQSGLTEGEVEYNGQINNARFSLLPLQNNHSNNNGATPSSSSRLENIAEISNAGIETSDLRISPAATHPIENERNLSNFENESEELVNVKLPYKYNADRNYNVVNSQRSSINVENDYFVNISSTANTINNNFVRASNTGDAENNNLVRTSNTAGTVNTIDTAINNAFNTNKSVLENNLVSAGDVTGKILEGKSTNQSVPVIDGTVIKNANNVNTLKIDNEGSTANLDELPGLIAKENVINRTNINSNEIDGKLAPVEFSHLRNKITSAGINHSSVDAEQATSNGLSNDELEVTSGKQIFNQFQLQEEAKNNVRDERLNIKGSLSDQNIFNDNVVRTNSKSDVPIDLNAAIKTQELTQDIKFTANSNIAIDKPYNANISSTELLSARATTGLEKLPLQLNAANEVNNGDELAQQITWARNNNTNHVRIAITPEHLGALEISIDNDVDGLNIQFLTQNATAKDALETFMPRLKDMLEQNGLSLQNANVSQQGSGNNSNADNGQSDQYSDNQMSDDAFTLNGSIEPATSIQAKNYLLEAFA